MAFKAVIHYPNSEEDRSKLIEDMAIYRIMIMREYLSKLETSSGNKIKIVDELLKEKQ
ncbi:MAG: hypothetical protein IJ470_00735 [Clostridia bacterium]|jgi:hypothetical protein|nr:hypothetical protein [Clostridia bacterium]